MEIATDRICKRIIVYGTIKNTSPLLIGTGEVDNDIDRIIQKDNEGNPFIPGSSFAGSLRHHYFERYSSRGFCEMGNSFWGSSKGEMFAVSESSFIVSDLPLIDKLFSLEVRDGVRINDKRGIAEIGGKFDYEILPRGHHFEMLLELVIREQDDNIEKILFALLRDLTDERVRIGAMTNKGFGKIKLHDTEVYIYDFTNPRDVINWLTDNRDSRNIVPLPKTEAIEIDNDFYLEAGFNLVTSLLVKSYPTEPGSPDAIHIESAKTPILPGTSLKGCIRARAVRIANTIGIPEKFVKELMGYVDNKPNGKEKLKSRFLVEETILSASYIRNKIQSRIKIDRFTGGTIKSALFETIPLFPNSKKTDEKIIIKLMIKTCREAEAGLMMLLLKDLWNSDLPIGGEKGIGRGILRGEYARIQFSGVKYTLERNGEKLQVSKSTAKNDQNTEEAKADMEKWVKKLHERKAEAV
jgi:CRISPR/Cas system CSM-associated protein Csm3 (group 7 of RAMP superfamily)